MHEIEIEYNEVKSGLYKIENCECGEKSIPNFMRLRIGEDGDLSCIACLGCGTLIAKKIEPENIDDGKIKIELISKWNKLNKT